MSAFEFISHESYPEDKYICESAVICIDGKYRVTYIRKITPKGGMFWDEISTSATQDGERRHLKSWKADSNFLREDIIAYLNKRSWEKGGEIAYQSDEAPF